MRLGTFFLLILSISLLTNHIFSHDQTVIPSNIQQIIRELDHEEKVLWQELERLGIRKQQVSILQKTCLQEYITCRKKLAKKAANKPFSAQFMQLIERILTDFNINKKSISIIRYSDPEQIATATDFQLFIDEDELSKFPVEAQEFLIAHELQHIIQKDDSERFFVYNHLNPTPEQETDPQHILNKLYRFQEKRADILALTKNKRYAQGNIAFSQYLLGLWGRDGDGIEHPTETMRIALASLFLNTFAKNQELIA